MKRKISIIISAIVLAVITLVSTQALAFTLPDNAQWVNKGKTSCKHSFYYSWGSDATCDYDGEEHYYCSNCGAEYKTIQKAKGHRFVKVLESKAKPQTAKREGTYGYTYKQCKVCGSTKDYKTINYPAEYKLSYTNTVYNGKAKKPTVVVKDCEGKKIADTNYTLTYSNNKKVGKATVKITFKNNYTGSVTQSFKIKPTKPTLNSVKYNSKGKITAKWKKNTTGAGYILQYSTSSKFSRRNTCTLIISSNSTLKKSLTDLAKKTYYVRVATYKSVDGYKYRSAWSDVKSVKVKSGASLKQMINHTKTDLSGRDDIKEMTHGKVDIKNYNSTYDRMKAIYDWHSKNNTKYFASCMECNMSFNDCLYYLYGNHKQYDDFIWLAAGSIKNSDGSVVIHKWSVISFQGVSYIVDPRLQGYTSDKTGTQYFGIKTGSKASKKYILDGYWLYWSQDSYQKIV